MTRMIPVLDLTTGTESARPPGTRTLDVPRSFDRHAAVASFDVRSRVLCGSVGGDALDYVAFTSPLSSRTSGEECLVDDGVFRATIAHPGRYRLSAVKPAHE
jgi:hypothetical protein